jgi:tetratricopeptide (TPR) repeat protein
MNYDFRTAPPRAAALDATLHSIEAAQLVRLSSESDATYIFKHALVQEGAYTSLTRGERRRLHRLVAQTLEGLNANALDENAALLAFHFERAEDSAQALAYLLRAAEWGRRSAAYREQAGLLKRAIAIAAASEPQERLSALYLKRGQALMNVAEWHEAHADLTKALEHVSPDDTAARAQILLDLASATQWLWDVATSIRYAEQALELAEQAKLDALAASAMAQLAVTHTSDGRPRDGIEAFQRAFARAGASNSLALVRGMEYFGLALYWLGDYEQAIARSQSAIERAHALADHVTIVRALSNLAGAQAGRGDYSAALASYQAARAYAQQHTILPWLARTISMQSGLHLDLWDYAGAEELIAEARAVSRAAQFSATIVASGIDLIFSSLRRGAIERADRYVHQVAQDIPQIYGSHRWVWEIRFLQARAELALVREQFVDAFQFADEAVVRCRATGRRKFELLGLITRAQARHSQSPDTAMGDLRAALDLAQQLGDPARLLHAALAYLNFDKDDAVRQIARHARARILASLPESRLREGFFAVSAEWL